MLLHDTDTTSSHVKHFDSRHHQCREQIELIAVAYEYHSSSNNLADSCTKALPHAAPAHYFFSFLRYLFSEFYVHLWVLFVWPAVVAFPCATVLWLASMQLAWRIVASNHVTAYWLSLCFLFGEISALRFWQNARPSNSEGLRSSIVSS